MAFLVLQSTTGVLCPPLHAAPPADMKEPGATSGGGSRAPARKDAEPTRAELLRHLEEEHAAAERRDAIIAAQQDQIRRQEEALAAQGQALVSLQEQMAAMSKRLDAIATGDTKEGSSQEERLRSVEEAMQRVPSCRPTCRLGRRLPRSMRIPETMPP